MKQIEKINRNIRDDIKKIELRGVEFSWCFNMNSLYTLLTDFEYKDEAELIQRLNEGSTVSILQVFYAGIIWDDNPVEFKDFLLFVRFEDIMDKLKEFLENNITDYLYPKKKGKRKTEMKQKI